MLSWQRRAYRELDRDELYDALALRCRVFIVEQVPYLDPDGLDRRAHHLLGRGADGTLAAYLRVLDPGAKYAEPSIGRVVVAPEARRGGLGRTLMHEGLVYCGALWPGQPIRIGAQAHLRDFYASLGFEPASGLYDEDGIQHVEMLRRAT